MSTKSYEIITDQIIKKLESGIVPWCKPWNATEDCPKNLISKRMFDNSDVRVDLVAGIGSGSLPLQTPAR